jgi:hypothetical protein
MEMANILNTVKKNLKVLKIVAIVCAIVGALVIGVIVLRIAFAILTSPLFWIIAVIGIALYGVYNWGKSNNK